MKTIDPNLLYFGQQKHQTQNYFIQHHNSIHTIPISQTPHYRMLCGDNKDYVEYLTNSWSGQSNNNDKGHQNQIQKSHNLLMDIQNNGCKTPIIICTRFDGKKIIYDGNHRSTISLLLGREVPYQEISIKEYLTRVTTVPDVFYGSQNKGIPYQSIYHNQQEILIGRRRDLLDRILMLNRTDLEGKTLLEFGCNLGINCILAMQLLGATKSTGIEYSTKITNAAIRVNTMFAQNICYCCLDLSKKIDVDRHDVGFCFSIDKHVKNNTQLADNILNSIRDVVYFETHSQSKMPTEISAIFKDVQLIGSLATDRKLFRCVV